VPCEACQLSKHHRVSFPSRVVRRVSSPFELVHSDVWGPINIASNKFHYFVTFVDDFSRMTWLFLMKNRTELFSIFQIFRNMIKTQFAQKIRILIQIMPKNIHLVLLPLICLIKALFIKPHVLTLHNKMVWLNARIVIYWMLHIVSCLICMSPNNFGVMLLSLLVISLIGCPPQS
jgi:hypothetical protein